MALPVALLAVRNSDAIARNLERSTYLVLAMPGIVIAFALSYFTERYADGFFYQSAPLLILAYAILFFPLALVGVKATVAHAPVSLEEVARSLGLGRLAVLRRVTLPLIAPGLAASFCLSPAGGGNRTHRHPDSGANRSPDPRHPILGLPAKPLLRSGRTVCPDDHRGCRSTQLRPRAVLRPPCATRFGLTDTRHDPPHR